MAKMKRAEIIVNTIFDGTQTGRQAFMDLIKEKNSIGITQLYSDNDQLLVYTEDKVNSDVHQIERKITL